MLLTVYDIETSGFIRGDEYPDVYQLGFIRVDDKFRVQGYGSLYFYDTETFLPYNQEAYEVHHISLDFLKTQSDDFLKNMSTAYAILNNSVVVGKNNIMFDNRVITNFINKYRQKKNVEPFSLGKSIDVQNYMGIYYREWCAKKGIQVSNRKKGTLEDYMELMEMSEADIIKFGKNNGIDLESCQENRNSPHDALYDALMTYICVVYVMLVKKVPMTPV